MHTFSNFAASGCLIGSPADIPDNSCLDSNSCDTKWGTTEVPGMKGFNVCCKKGAAANCYGSGGNTPSQGGSSGHLPSCRYNGYGDIFKINDPSWSSGGLPDIPDCDCSSYGDSLNGVCNQLKSDPNDPTECTTGNSMSCPVHGGSGNKPVQSKPVRSNKLLGDPIPSKKMQSNKLLGDPIPRSKSLQSGILGPGGAAPSVMPSPNKPVPSGTKPSEPFNPLFIGLIILAIVAAFFLLKKNRKTFFGKRK